MHDKLWGEAKLAFESGLDKLTRRPSTDPELADRLRQKLHRSKEALAVAHHDEASDLVASGCHQEAIELLTVAADLTADPQFKNDLTEKIDRISVLKFGQIHQPDAATHDAPFDDDTSFESESEHDLEDSESHFELLLSALPDDIRQAYGSYGRDFQLGYLALNRGEFEIAAEHLERADEENRSPQSQIPLELATAYVNLGQADKARELLEDLISGQPGFLSAYPLLCEIYWEAKQFDIALQLIDTLPPELAQSKEVFLIRGETLLRADRSQEARAYYQGLYQKYGQDESIAMGLARAHEKLGEPTQALDLYRQMISRCSGCGSRINPVIRRRYADLSFSSGQFTAEVLEHYLELSQVDPVNAAHYYQNISRIYSELGNDSESHRFQAIAQNLT